MALTKSFPLLQNPEWAATYARIDALAYHRTEKVLEITVGFYADEHTAAERPPINSRPFRWQGEEAELIIAALHDEAGRLAYDVLKASPEFADAQDNP